MSGTPDRNVLVGKTTNKPDLFSFFGSLPVCLFVLGPYQYAYLYGRRWQACSGKAKISSILVLDPVKTNLASDWGKFRFRDKLQITLKPLISAPELRWPGYGRTEEEARNAAAFFALCEWSTEYGPLVGPQGLRIISRGLSCTLYRLETWFGI